MSSETPAALEPVIEALEWRELLLDRPPGSRALIDRPVFIERTNSYSTFGHLPELQLFCDGKCKGDVYCKGSHNVYGSLFGQRNSLITPDVKPNAGTTPPLDILLQYRCTKCERFVKSYGVRVHQFAKAGTDPSLVEVEKLVEWPPFAPPTPSKVIKLIGPDRDYFLKGRRAEILGMGIAAFAYYRRIVEGQKNRLLDEVIKVAQLTSAPPEAIRQLEVAKVETQFSKAVDDVKDVIPKALYIKSHNPLTLLHSALSEGIHASTDEACLKAANDVRLFLVQFSEKLNVALQEQKELDEALNRFLNRAES